MKRVLNAIYEFLEASGRARTAAILASQHRYKEARYLMTGNDNG